MRGQGCRVWLRVVQRCNRRAGPVFMRRSQAPRTRVTPESSSEGGKGVGGDRCHAGGDSKGQVATYPTMYERVAR